MRIFHSVFAAAIVLTLGACTQTAQMAPSTDSAGRSATPVETFPSFPDIPVAAGSQMNIDKTVVLGGEQWFGQLSIQASFNAHQMFEFYRDQLPKYGWEEISAVRAPTSVLTFSRDNRILALQITGSRFAGSDLTLSVAPRIETPPPAPPPSASPTAPVTTLPPIKSN